jgi:phenylacetate-CoA ligase
LILTPLGRAGAPLLRYKTGDIVKTSTQQPCQCGRFDLSLEGGILGRVDDMVVVRGVNVYPTAFEDLLRNFSQVADYQIEVDKTKPLAELRLQVEPVHASAGANLANEIQDTIQNTFHLRVPVTMVSPGTLPRYEMKAKRWKVKQ